MPRLTLTKKNETTSKKIKPVILTEDPKRKPTRLCDKLETPGNTRKRKFTLDTRGANPKEKTFSLVNRKKSTGMSDMPLKHNSCIVCLKVNKTLFNQIFSEDKKSKNINPLSEKNHLGRIIDESISNLSDTMNYELSQDKTLNIPEIYGLAQFDIKPEQVNFKRFCDIDEECLNQKLNNYKISDKKIHLVLASFKNKSWPLSSPYNCWYCDEPFNNAPVGIPTIAMSDSYEDTYYLEGNYCSFNCAARDHFENCKSADSQSATIYEIMNFIYNEVNDSDEYEKIELSPDRKCLKKFGGPLTYEEFKKNHLTNIRYELFKSPLIPALYHIQENIDLNRLIKSRRK